MGGTYRQLLEFFQRRFFSDEERSVQTLISAQYRGLIYREGIGRQNMHFFLYGGNLSPTSGVFSTPVFQ
jgi:hypothetical protein